MKFHIAIFFLLLSTEVKAQEAYKWKDSEGRTIYGAKPPKSNSKYESFKVRGLSTYSEKKVLKSLGRNVTENKEKKSSGVTSTKGRSISQQVNKPKFKTVDEVMLKSGIPKVTFDKEGLITSCEVEVANETNKQVFEISVAFEMPDGKLIPASGPFTLEKGASANFFIPNELLPIDAKMGDNLGDLSEEEDSKNQALPKVILHSLGGE